MSDSVMAMYEFRGDPAEMAARYDDVLHKVVALSSGRPVVHLAAPQDWGLLVIDVWNSQAAYASFAANEDFTRVLAEPASRTAAAHVPVHNLGWPVDAMPLYR